MYIVNVKKQQILNLDIRTVTRAIRNMEKTSPDTYQQLVIVVDGYNDIPDELYEIKEVRNWVRKLFESVPHLLYFINREVENHVWLLSSIADVRSFQPEKIRKPVVELLRQGYETMPKYLMDLELSGKRLTEISNAINQYGQSVHQESHANELVLLLAKMFNGRAR